MQFDVLKTVISSFEDQSQTFDDNSKQNANISLPAVSVLLHFVSLMITYSPDQLLSFLRKYAHLLPSEECITILNNFPHIAADAFAFLLQRTGQRSQALKALFASYEHTLRQAQKEMDLDLQSLAEILVKPEGPAREEACARMACCERLRHLAECIADVCDSALLTAQDSETWFQAFDFLLATRQSLRHGLPSSSGEVLAVLVGMSLQTLLARMKSANASLISSATSRQHVNNTSNHTMNGGVTPQHIIRRITSTGEESVGGMGVRLGELRDVVRCMLWTDISELAFSEAVRAVLRADLSKLCARKADCLRKASYRSEGVVVELDTHNEVGSDGKAYNSRKGAGRARGRLKRTVPRLDLDRDFASNQGSYRMNTTLPMNITLSDSLDEQEPRRPGSLPTQA
eukprot:CAMPEP_0170066566 /NCGR_PEP_ID=MMETSP0019_2-20121128/6218_1 /TAXON_ID=98059 /ORGANISM="Dinobryon sp., Strain UTEXLB2267" /LENGTH=400 /DNA_ID=CAMNT_0010273693 /DNA_START=686 /DNA_END=1884 /DNA_ORIENTATION=+